MIADMSMLHLTQEKRPAVEMVAALMVTRAIGQGWVAQQSKLHGRFTEPGIMCFRQRIRHSFGFLPTPLERHNTTWTPCGLCARLRGAIQICVCWGLLTGQCPSKNIHEVSRLTASLLDMFRQAGSQFFTRS